MWQTAKRGRAYLGSKVVTEELHSLDLSVDKNEGAVFFILNQYF